MTPASEAFPSPDAPAPAPGDQKARKEPTGWRAKLPKIPDPVHVALPGLTPRLAFFGWLAIALVLAVGGVFLNFHLTDGTWVTPEPELANEQNPFGTTRTQFLDLAEPHPYDLLTASLFVGSILLLGLSLVPQLARYRVPLRVVGWTVFAFHWATTAVNLYVIEEGDWVNMTFALASVFVLTYFAYQELVSRRLGKENDSLHFAVAAVVIASVVWYAFLRIEPLSKWIIEVVAAHTVWMLELFGQDVALRSDGRTGFESRIVYPNATVFPPRSVIIILACTAIQSMMIFVAAALAVRKAPWQNRVKVIAVTVPIVYILNLVRNTLIVGMWSTKWLEMQLGITSEQSFSIAHNWIGKFGSLLALIAIAWLVFAIMPEIVAAVVGLLDLPRRRGPIEQYYQSLPAGTGFYASAFVLGAAGFGTLAYRYMQTGAWVTDYTALSLLLLAAGAAYLGGERRRARGTPDADADRPATTVTNAATGASSTEAKPVEE